MKASLSNYRQSPRKVRLVADVVRGKKVRDAVTALSFLPKRASDPIKKLILSAAANAKVEGKDVETLIVSRIAIDKGVVTKRFMPRARGSASPLNRRSSHIALELGEMKAK